jgi:hypothetical protein
MPVIPLEIITPPTPPPEEEGDKIEPSVVFDAKMFFLMRSPSPRVSQRVKPNAAHLDPTTASAALSKKIYSFLKQSNSVLKTSREKGRSISYSPESWWSASSRSRSTTVDDEVSC